MIYDEIWCSWSMECTDDHIFYCVLSPVHYFYRYYHDRSECSIAPTRKGAGDHNQSNGQQNGENTRNSGEEETTCA